MQKKWVELFEKVIGRKPSPEEFMAGKACGFDLKQIQSIAGNAPEEVAPVRPLSGHFPAGCFPESRRLWLHIHPD